MLETFSVSLESLNIFSIFPMLIAIVGALIILIVDMCLKTTNKQLYTMLTILFLGMDLGYIMFFGMEGIQRAFFDLILIDGGIGQVNAVQGVLSALNLDVCAFNAKL